MTQQLPRRKKIRLDRDTYAGPGAFSVTAGTFGRRPHFKNPPTVALSEKAMQEAAIAEGMELLAYCFMPDHLHLLIKGTPGSNLTPL